MVRDRSGVASPGFKTRSAESSWILRNIMVVTALNADFIVAELDRLRNFSGQSLGES